MNKKLATLITSALLLAPVGISNANAVYYPPPDTTFTGFIPTGTRVHYPAPTTTFRYYTMSGIKEKITHLSKTDQKYLDRALALAALSDMKQRHGALIVKGGRVVAYGFNTFRNLPHPDMPGHDYSYHAEDNALRYISAYDFAGAKIYVARISRRGFPALSRPCDSCMTKLIRAGIKEIIYTTSENRGF